MRFLKTCLFFVSSIILLQVSAKAQFIGVIPQPQSLVLAKDSVIFSKNLNIDFGKIEESSAQYFKSYLFDRFRILTSTNTKLPFFVSFENSSTLKEEAYELLISTKNITIKSSSESGFLHGMNTLFQIIFFHEKKGTIKLPTLTISDAPSLVWRGFMLDESRHFFGKEKVKQLLDYMAYYKLNKFHWHLTDEPAWRLEIKQYPFLSLIGGIGSFLNPILPAQFYTQEDIKEIILYANQRKIEVIPEIDMPGHATAANRAYPQFSGGGTEAHPDFTFHPAKEGTYTFLSNILKETQMLFPSKYVHLGGDEVSFGSEAWNKDEQIKALKAKFEYTTNKEVELHFMRRMADSVYAMGGKVIAWDEMADSGLPKDKTIMMWWRHDKESQLDLAIKNGYSVILTPRLPFYFDFVQEENHKYGRKWAGGYSPLKDVYHFDISKYKKKGSFENQILGVQANLWTERVHNENRLDYMVFPRIAALAETSWTNPDKRDYDRFLQVLKKHLERFKSDDIYFYDPFDDRNVEPSVPTFNKKYIDNP